MKTGHKIAAYALAVGIVFGGSWAAGAAVGPIGDATPPEQPMAHEEKPPAETGVPPGLSASDKGYTLQVRTTTPQLAFQITGPDGEPVTRFAVEHEKRLHLVLVRRDGSGYQHLHPRMAADGTWTTPLTLPDAGSYRVFTDFRAENGPKTTLGADVQVAGDYQPRQHAISRSSTVDGYTVTLAGDLEAGASSTVTATVTRNGQQVTDLQKYLGANGHLVALRRSDLAYLHVHPHEEPGRGPDVRFAVEVPTSGEYRLFLDFQHDGQVRTAEFTLDTDGTPPPAAPTTEKEDGHGHG